MTKIKEKCKACGNDKFELVNKTFRCPRCHTVELDYRDIFGFDFSGEKLPIKLGNVIWSDDQ